MGKITASELGNFFTPVVKSSGTTYTAAPWDAVIVTTGAAFTVTLPVGPVLGDQVTVKDGATGSAGAITVVPSAGTIDGAVSYILKGIGGNATFVYNGTTWSVLHASVTTSSNGLRNAIVQGVLDANGRPAFLAVGTGLAVNLLATAMALVLAFAYGNAASGAPNDPAPMAILADQPSAWSGLTINATNYLYINRNPSTGALTFGASLVPPMCQTTTPTNGSDMSISAAAISSGDNGAQAKGLAFDKNSSTYWLSSQTGAAVNGAAYIGQDFGVASYSFGQITVNQAIQPNAVTSAIVQISTDGTTWTNLQTITLSPTTGVQTFALSTNSGNRAIRLLANSATNGGSGANSWAVYEMTVAYAITTDQHWYNPVTSLMQVYNGSTWSSVQRLFMGYAITNGTAVISVASYPIGNLNIGGSLSAPGNSAFRAVMTTSQALSAGVFTKMQFQLVESDNQNEYDTTNNRFKAKQNGLYLVTANLYYGSVATNNQGFLEVWVNGISRRRIDYKITPISANQMVSGTTQVILNAGDYVEIYGQCSAGASLMATGSTYTYLEMTKVG